MDRKQLEALSKEELIDIILVFSEQITELKAQINTNSRNSSKPPSTDGLAKLAVNSLGKKQDGSLADKKATRGMD